jgi:hypothetical protein
MMSDAKRLEVPSTLQQATDPAWLQRALAPVIGAATVESVETVEVIRTMATKVRFRVKHSRGSDDFCLKGFLDVDAGNAAGGSTMIREADFYSEIAPKVQMRLADCVVKVIDREAQTGAIIMRDLITTQGARMCNALVPLGVDVLTGTLTQLAALHAGGALLKTSPWITHRVLQNATRPHLSVTTIQELFDGPRSEGLPTHVTNAERLMKAMKSLADRDLQRPQSLVHGDCHAGNIFLTDAGPGFLDWQLIQRGHWALDVAYHINALLPVDVAEKEEVNLLRQYLQAAQALGTAVPSFDEAFTQYREAVVYGFYLWVITRRVAPELTNMSNYRLGSAVTRHDSYRLLGVS